MNLKKGNDIAKTCSESSFNLPFRLYHLFSNFRL